MHYFCLREVKRVPVCGPISKDEQQPDHLSVGFELGSVPEKER